MNPTPLPAPGQVARILLATSSAGELQALQASLVTAGHVVTVRKGASFALNEAAWARFDLVLLDLEVHDLSLIRELRQSPHIGYVLALVPGGHEVRVQCLDQGADDCLSRPWDVREVMARARALLRRCGEEPAPVGARVRAGDLEIDPATGEVRRGGRQLRLTPREFSLLAFLLENRGKVLSTAAIRSHLYPNPPACTPNAVTSLIRQLRGKLDSGSDPPLIRTIWGRGYLFRSEGGQTEAAGNNGKVLGVPAWGSWKQGLGIRDLDPNP
jgi:DNA-binding response OmpR family regulator